MEISTGLLSRRSTRVKNRCTFLRAEARQFHFFERCRWERRNPRPVMHVVRNQFPRFTKFAVGCVMGELKREQHQRQAVEFSVMMGKPCRIRHRLTERSFFSTDADEIPNTGCENGQFGWHCGFRFQAGFPLQPYAETNRNFRRLNGFLVMQRHSSFRSSERQRRFILRTIIFSNVEFAITWW